MDPLLKTKRVLKTRLSRISAAIVPTLSALDAIAYLDKVNRLEEEFNALLLGVSQVCDDQLYETYEAEFNEIDAKLHRLKVGLCATNIPQPPTTNKMAAGSVSELRLPRIELPTFAGEYELWVTFHDLFVAAVHENSVLSDAQKLQYLKASVKGEAALLIQSIPIANANYSEAWEILLQRYQNVRQIVNAHLDRLLTQSIVPIGSAIALRRLVDVTNECVRSIRVQGVPIQHWDAILVHIISKLLDAESRKDWELSLQRSEMPSFAQLILFLDQRAHALAIATSASKSYSRPKTSSDSAVWGRSASVHYGGVGAKCEHCKGDHSLHKCNNFIRLAVADRESEIKRLGLCFNCLRAGHQSHECKGGRCRTCNGHHHTLIHHNNSTLLASDQEDVPVVATHHFSKPPNMAQILLSTALVRVCAADGRSLIFRALLDSASQASLITENCVQKLGLKKTKATVSITGVTAQGIATSYGSVQLSISSLHQPEDTFTVNTLVLPKITTMQPTTHVKVGNWKHYKTLPLADPQFFEPGNIDILLGADIYAELLESGICKGPIGAPIALQTRLGWVLTGRLCTSEKGPISSYHIQCLTDATIHRFWDLDENGGTKFMTPEETLCEEHFRSTHSRDETGRFSVRLPFRPNTLDLGVSRDSAIRRLKSVERHLGNSAEQQQQYKSFMSEYLTLGHMESIPRDEAPLPVGRVYYLPHHAVIKSKSTTTKLRVVFDASAGSSSGVSLNDKLMVGPKVQEDIVPLVLRFRCHSVAMTADITKMYRQIRMDPSDTNFLRIVWRWSPDQPIQDFRLCTVTYGTSSAPFQATRCLQQLAEDEKEHWPRASAILSRDFYVDDLLTGASSEHEALQLQSELIQLLSSGGFSLCKWSSNSTALLEAIPSSSRETSSPLQIGGDQGVKALGINWHPDADYFSFTVPALEQNPIATKRSLLSDLAKLYDPLGWLSPTTINAKLLFQSLWKVDLGWDQPVPESFQAQWTQYCEDLPWIQDIMIPRHVCHPNSSSHQLHAFCDSSERAYAAVVYLRSMSLDGKLQVSLVAAKTKVAPLKTQSLPRLELCGAVLLSGLVKLIRQSLDFVCDVYAYTDSNIVLAWLASSPSRWKTFVANRVSEVQGNLPDAHWHHISTSDNPADCASRGISPLSLITFNLWWNGPEMLQRSECLPTVKADISCELLEVEQRKVAVTLCTTLDLSMLHRFSSLNRLQRITAWCLRFVHNAKISSHSRIQGNLSISELHHALLRWIHLIQGQEFSKDIHQLRKNAPLPTNSHILCLNPFLDKLGLLRVGGRLSRSQLPEDAKYPLLLPSKHILTRLIISQEHLNTLHGGSQLVLTALRQHYWILNGRDAIRGVIHRCIVCHRQRVALSGQMMADLPAARVTPSRPFTHTGVDYAGPFLLRVLKGRGHKTFKGYISLFVCFSTRAIHLELVSDLSSSAFIASLKRFVARRGKPTMLYSDCGTNFVGADKELRELSKTIQDSATNGTLSHHLSDLGINWEFNPPSAPHFGGLWEAGIKSVKHHLRRIVGNTTLNFEEMITILAQIEACLNSRPLSALSSDPTDFSALTPGHFLIGGPLLAIPEPDFTPCKVNRLTRWQYSQQLVQHFWRRWSVEYLSRLQRRPKWWTKKQNLEVGDLVLIKDDNLPPLKWKMGRVVLLHVGNDQLV